MDIRIMTIDDYEQVYTLWLSCKGMGLNSIDDSREGIERYLKRNPETCFIAEDGGKAVGVIISGHDGRRGFIYHTAVSPDYRRQGIAAALVERAAEALKKEGIAKAALVVFAENENGNAFWEKIGFTERTDLVYRNKTLDANMKKINT